MMKLALNVMMDSKIQIQVEFSFRRKTCKIDGDSGSEVEGTCKTLDSLLDEMLCANEEEK